MTTLLTLLNAGGGASEVQEGTYWAPYYIGGGTLLLLLALVWAVMSFGKGREHS